MSEIAELLGTALAGRYRIERLGTAGQIAGGPSGRAPPRVHQDRRVIAGVEQAPEPAGKIRALHRETNRFPERRKRSGRSAALRMPMRGPASMGVEMQPSSSRCRPERRLARSMPLCV